MAMEANAKGTSVVPSEEDIAIAQETQPLMAELESQSAENARYTLTDKQGVKLKISSAMFEALVQVVDAMASGKAIKVVPMDAELTTQQAADMLNVSRPYIVSLLESGKIPSHKVGRYRRIRFEDMRVYQMAQEMKRQTVMSQLADDAQELDLGY